MSSKLVDPCERKRNRFNSHRIGHVGFDHQLQHGIVFVANECGMEGWRRDVPACIPVAAAAVLVGMRHAVTLQITVIQSTYRIDKLLPFE